MWSTGEGNGKALQYSCLENPMNSMKRRKYMTPKEKLPRWRSPIKSAKTRPGADCGSDHELLIAKFRLKFKKIGKTTRSFRYDLNQTPYDYTVEVINRD